MPSDNETRFTFTAREIEEIKRYLYKQNPDWFRLEPKKEYKITIRRKNPNECKSPTTD